MAMKLEDQPHVPSQASPLASRAVIGLEHGRKSARKQQKRQQRRARILSTLGTLVLVAILAVTAWVGYTFFTEQQAAEQIEIERRQAELVDTGTGDDLRDAIDELEVSPKWNGPGNPTFGVGDGEP